jgi:NitT/TauT family transport system ATP-binding protein
MTFLTIEHVSHTYFTKDSMTHALEDISLSIEEGEFISFLGPSGCGKSTLLSIIAGLIHPTEGQVLLNGRHLSNQDASIGYMLQQDYLFPWKTIEENIFIGLKIRGELTENNRLRSLSLLNQMGLKGVENQYPKQLSGGMRQRAALVRTLSTNPQLLLLDEPFSALDYLTKLKLEDLVSNILKQFGKTALLVTHDIGEAIAMSDRIFVFSKRPGKIIHCFHVPIELRSLTPFEARQEGQFTVLFQKIWKELDDIEEKQR